MTYAAKEESAYGGSPERLFLFSMGNVSMGYVNSPLPANYLGVDYESTSVDIDDLQQSLSEDSPTLQLRIDSQTDIARQFIPYMPITPVRLRVYRHHFDDADGEYKSEIIGEVTNGSIDHETDMCVLSVRLFHSKLDRKVPWPVYQKQCNYVLYGPGCRVDREAFKTETTVTGVVSNAILSADFAAIAALKADPRWFVAGYVVRVSNNETRWVIAQNEDVLTLQSPFVGLQEGEAVVAYAGCDLLKATCELKFNNLDRHFGFPWPPNKNPFTDNLFGTGSPASGGSTNPGGSFGFGSSEGN